MAMIGITDQVLRMLAMIDQVSRMLPMCVTVYGKSIIVYTRKSSIENEYTNGNKEKEVCRSLFLVSDWLQNCTAASSLDV